MTFSPRHLASRAVKVSAAAVDAVRHPSPGVVILLYHRVGAGSGLEIDLPASRFSEQMAVLAEEMRVLTLDRALAEVAGPVPQPEDPAPVAVTFDDGTADFVDVALPILEHHRVPVTLYLATGFVGSDRGLAHDGPALSWGALEDAVGTGLVTVGSHTHTHALLDRLDAGRIDQELDRSTKSIEDHLGLTAEHFAYPKALAGSPAAAVAVRRRFRSAALAGTRANPYGDTDPFRLSRSPVQVSDGMRWFRRKLAGGMGMEDDLRRLANLRRYSGRSA